MATVGQYVIDVFGLKVEGNEGVLSLGSSGTQPHSHPWFLQGPESVSDSVLQTHQQEYSCHELSISS